MFDARVVCGKRRFTCLSPTLVRMEFAPDGVFEERRSLVAAVPQTALAFRSAGEEGGQLLLDAGALTIVSRGAEEAFFPENLEVRWLQGGLLQYWRPGDHDYHNLGGTVRSLDRYDGTLPLTGVHAAGMESPDATALTWLSWLQDEDDPWFYENSPRKIPGGSGHLPAAVRHNPERVLQRTRNHLLEHCHFAPGVLSRSGYFFLNDSLSPVLDETDFPIARKRPGYQDWYFFAYGTDYRAGLADFARLCGSPAFLPRQALGAMFCRWPAPAEKEAKEIVQEFNAHGVPLSTLILDMEWHKEGWGHWEWDPTFYADPAAFIRWCHEQDLLVALNDHPLDLRADDCHYAPYVERAGTIARARNKEYNKKEVEMIDIDLCNKGEAEAFVEICHKPIVAQGIDFWWNDGCKGKLSGTTNQLVCNKLMHGEFAAAGRRGMVLARYGGLGSHRYGIYFTGDTYSTWEVLRTQCEFNIRAGQVGMGWVSHDIGGFCSRVSAPLLNPVLYARWVQFGAFGPVFRLHSAPGTGSRKPWDYGAEVEGATLPWLRARQRLLPYLYAAAREQSLTGVPVIRGLYLDHPEDEAAYRYDEYMFGPSILVAPVMGEEPYRQVYLPAGEWYAFQTAERIGGGREFSVHAPMSRLPCYVRAGTVLTCQSSQTPAGAKHLEQIELQVYPFASGATGADVHTAEALLYEDDGAPEERMRHCCTQLTLMQAGQNLTLRGAVGAGEPLGEKRSIALMVYCGAMPKVAQFGGAPLTCVEAGKGCWRIELPVLSAVSAWTVSLEL